MARITKGVVLVVEDEEVTGQVLQSGLRDKGFATCYARNSREALELVESKKPDVILLDLVLGYDEDGLSLFEKIRSLPFAGEIPILLMSGYADIDSRLEGLNLGASDFIQKPFDVREVAARIGLHVRLAENQRLLQRRNEELAKANEDLKTAQARMVETERVAAFGHLAAGVVHEISTPLGFIISNLKTLSSYVQDLSAVLDAFQDLTNAAKQHDALKPQTDAVNDICERVHMDDLQKEMESISKECLDGSESIARIAEDLREFFRDDPADFVASDINRLVEKAFGLSRSAIGERLLVEKNYGELPTIECIPGRITQALVILLTNAAQAMGDDGVLSLRTEQVGNSIKIRVSDTGPGIPGQDLERIFEPFFTTRAKEGGMGLGLSIAQKIITFHHGTITVESKEGEGSHFIVILPLIASLA